DLPEAARGAVEVRVRDLLAVGRPGRRRVIVRVVRELLKPAAVEVAGNDLRVTTALVRVPCDAAVGARKGRVRGRRQDQRKNESKQRQTEGRQGSAQPISAAGCDVHANRSSQGLAHDTGPS